MYEWLTDRLVEEGSHVVTANRRLARVLNTAYADRRVAAGELAWRSPVIVPASAWFGVLGNSLAPRPDRPVRIGSHAARLLWEACLARDLDDPMLNLGALARQCHETWNRMQDWCVPLAECQAEANGQDQRIFARAAGRYVDRLDSGGWTDEALYRRQLPTWIEKDDGDVPERVVLAGFDRITPALRALLDKLEHLGSVIEEVPASPRRSGQLARCANPDVELRSAGAWARAALQANPAARLAVVVNGLEAHGDRAGRLIREGASPGWQCAGPGPGEAVNVSYGRRLSDYPAVSISLLALRWFAQPLDGENLSLLLRSPLIGRGDVAGRCRLEILLRKQPDRAWTPAGFLDAFASAAEKLGGAGWIADWREQGDSVEHLPRSQSPRAWAEAFDELLTGLGWPGQETRNSADFQLENRWRELLGEFARLELVSPEMSLADAIGRLSGMAAETLFQPEAGEAVVDVLGPLEAAGLEFDGLWIAGLTAADWPPPGRPVPLLSLDLQRRYGMPDAQPEDTVNHAAEVLDRLVSGSKECIVSYAETDGDAEQMPTSMIADEDPASVPDDPGWFAATLMGTCRLVDAPDRVPPVSDDEVVSGGARTISLQASNPFAAFATGRLGIRTLQAFRKGIAPDTRGNLIHDALHALYAHGPSRNDIAAWDEAERSRRIEAAVNRAFVRYERFADRTLRALLALERQRTAALLDRVIDVDIERAAFTVAQVEQEITGDFGPVSLALRCDRVDRLDDGSRVILDYKSGRSHKFLNKGEPADLQLLVYASAADVPLSGLGLYRVDSALVDIDGVGPAIRDVDNWAGTLDGWREQVRNAAAAFARGDVRLNAHQKTEDARPLNLLSRFTELSRDH